MVFKKIGNIVAKPFNKSYQATKKFMIECLEYDEYTEISRSDTIGGLLPTGYNIKVIRSWYGGVWKETIKDMTIYGDSGLQKYKFTTKKVYLPESISKNLIKNNEVNITSKK